MFDEIHKIKDTTIAARREQAKEQQILTQVNNRLSKHYQFNTYNYCNHQGKRRQTLQIPIQFSIDQVKYWVENL